MLTATGGLDQLAVAEVPQPELREARDVRVAIRAAALNHLDLFVIRGLPGVTYSFPHVLGADGAGVVDAVGSEVRSVRPGDRVMINPGLSDGTCEYCRAGEQSLCVRFRLLGEHLWGTLAEHVVIPERNVAVIPPIDPELAWSEAAAFSLVTLTAWRMVVTRAAVRRGDWVLVWGVGGGVSLAALRIAILHGARVIATSGDAAKLAQARSLGAEATLDHGSQDVAAEVRALTGKRGVDVVVENVGAATWETSLRCLAKGGRLVTCGATSGPTVTMDLRRVFWNQYAILGSTMGNAGEYEAVVRVLATGALRPIVDRTYPLTEARTAFERLGARERFGKVVVQF